MAECGVSKVALSNDIESVIGSNGDEHPAALARRIADELATKYEIRRKPTTPKSYEGKPRGGGLW